MAENKDFGVATNVLGDIPQNRSWLQFACRIEYIQDNHVVNHKPMQGSVVVQQPAWDITRGFQQANTARGDQPPTTRGTQGEDIQQRLGRPTAMLALIGSAVRLKYQIPIPEIKKFQGQDVVEVSRRTSPSSLLTVLGRVPVYASSWYILYQLPTTQTRPMPTLNDPWRQVDGQGN